MSISAPRSHSFRHVARVVIEFTTPFHVGTGEGGYGADALVVTDANGLPTIPGSSLAGALRAAFLAHTGGRARTDSLFGFQEGDQGCGSRLSLTWAVIHDRNDQPVEGLRARSCLNSDPVLNEALGLRIRDHVRLSHRGAAEHRGKFDDSPVAAGHRFTFELELVSQQQDDPDWQALLDTLASQTLRLGGKSRRGYGAFRVERIAGRTFNLSDAADFAAYAAHPASLSQPAPALTTLSLPATRNAPNSVTITLRLRPRGYWMFGGGEDTPPPDADPADMAPVRDERIVWQGSTGGVQEKLLLLPGSAIKGALAHRVAFHDNRLRQRFADDCAVAGNCPNDAGGHRVARAALERITGINNPAVRDLFGYVAEGKGTDPEGQAARGRVLIDDVFWGAPPPPQQKVPHVSIDRFTGGASDSKLFSERPLWQGEFPELKLTVLDADQIPTTTRQALKAALEDLVQGRLALGAGAGRGLGFFEPAPGGMPAVECSAGDDWFNQSPQPQPSHAPA
jgi:CRISPR/Cas system CSM-associated protein Csm3 (group 7 of RAMP superfamily)